jgi:hypothetical protein
VISISHYPRRDDGLSNQDMRHQARKVVREAAAALRLPPADVEAVSPLRALIARWENYRWDVPERAGFIAAAAELKALLSAPVASAEEET